MNVLVLCGAFLYLLAGIWPSVNNVTTWAKLVSVRLAMCGFMLLGSPVSIAGGLLTARPIAAQIIFVAVHAVVLVIAIGLGTGLFLRTRRERR